MTGNTNKLLTAFVQDDMLQIQIGVNELRHLALNALFLYADCDEMKIPDANKLAEEIAGIVRGDDEGDDTAFTLLNNACETLYDLGSDSIEEIMYEPEDEDDEDLLDLGDDDLSALEESKEA